MPTDRPDRPNAGQTPLHVPLPIAKRLNRNALTVAAVVMFLTVLVAVITTRTTQPHSAVRETDPVPPPTAPLQPSFLDLRAPTDSAHPATAPHGLDNGMSGGGPGSDVTEGTAGELGPTAGAPVAGPLPPVPPSPPQADPRQEAYRRALASPVVATGAATGAAADAPGRGKPLMTDTTEEALLNAILGSATSGGNHGTVHPADTPADAGATPGTTERPTPPRTATDGTSSLLATRVPTRPNQLDAGTVIPAALATAINSDLPGHLLAYVTRNVYDSRTQRTIVIPQGTKLIGDYNNTIAGGQQRLLIAWTRLIFPNGASVTLPGLNSTDATGASGVPGHVDTHTRRVFGNALLLSVLSAGIQLSQPRQGNVYAPPTAGQVAAGAVGQQLGDVATEMLRKNLEIPPTITLAAGTPFNVWLASDLVLPTR